MSNVMCGRIGMQVSNVKMKHASSEQVGGGGLQSVNIYVRMCVLRSQEGMPPSSTECVKEDWCVLYPCDHHRDRCVLTTIRGESPAAAVPLALKNPGDAS
jgi:hypothetical protein